jgi:hypothetical protein
MKINLNEEQIKFLLELQNELKTQDNRATRNPIYVIMETKRFVTEEGIDEDGWSWIDDGEEVGDDDALFEHLIEYNRDLLLRALAKTTDLLYADINIMLDEEIKDLFIKNIDGVLEYGKSGGGWANLYKWHYQNIDQISESACYSFFEKDSFEHLEMNKNNLTSPRTYACSMVRTPRMEKLRELLLNLEVEE